MSLILLILLVVLLVGAVPAWPYSRGWGYYPSGGVGLLVLILIILLLTGRIWRAFDRRAAKAGPPAFAVVYPRGAMNPAEIVWRPTAEVIEQSRLTRLLRKL